MSLNSNSEQGRTTFATGAALTLIMTTLVGCGGPQDFPAQAPPVPMRAAGLVAVVDLDAVANRTGLSGRLAGSVKSVQDNLNNQLKKIQADLQAKLEEKKGALEHAPAKDKPKLERELKVVQAKLQQILDSTQREAQQKLAAHTKNVVTNIRQTLRPIVEDVARQKEFDVVLTSNPEVIYVCLDQADITDEVVERLLAGAKPATEEPAAAVVDPTSAPDSSTGSADSPDATPQSAASDMPSGASSSAESADPERRTIRVEASEEGSEDTH